MIDPAADVTNTNTSPSAGGDGGCDNGIIILSKPSRLSRRARRGLALSTSVGVVEMESAQEQEQQQQQQQQESAESFVGNAAAKQQQQQQQQQTATESLLSIADTADTSTSVSNSSIDVSSATPSAAPFTIVTTPARNRSRRNQQQQQQQQRSRRLSNPTYTTYRKAVSFNLDCTTTHDVEAVSGMTDEEVDAIWYSERDLDDMQEDVANALYALTQAESGRGDTACRSSSDENVENGHDSELPDGRGLEGMRTAEERAQLRRARERTWDAVLDEQDRQWDVIDANDGQDEWGETVEGSMLLDPDALGEVSRQTTADCVATALQLAKEDAELVEQMVREDMVQNARAARSARAAISRSRKTLGGGEDILVAESLLSRSALTLQVSRSDDNEDDVINGPALPPQVLRDSRSARLATRRGSTGSLPTSSLSARRATRPDGIDSGLAVRTSAVGAARKSMGSSNRSPASAPTPTPPPAAATTTPESPPRGGRPMLYRSGGPSRITPDALRDRPERTTNISGRDDGSVRHIEKDTSVLENLRSARQMERYGESRRFLATGGSFRSLHPSSDDADPYIISEAGSIPKPQEIASRKLRKGKHKKSGLSAKAEYRKNYLNNKSSNNSIDQQPPGIGRVGTLLKGKIKLGKHQSRKGGSDGAEGLLSKQSGQGHEGIEATASAATASLADNASSRNGGKNGAYDFIPLEA